MSGMTETTTPENVLARNIAAVRVRRGMQQQDLADRMRVLGWGWVRQTVGVAERGQRRLSTEELLGMAVALETTVTRLLTPSPEDGAVELPSGLALSPEVTGSLVSGNPAGHVRWQSNKNVAFEVSKNT